MKEEKADMVQLVIGRVMKDNNYTESKIQQSVIVWFKNTYCLKHHSPRYLIFSIPNESKSKKETLNKMAIGMLPGAADLVVLLPGGRTIFAECKTPVGRQSPAQIRFETHVKELGFDYFVFRSLEEFKEKIEEYVCIINK